MSIYERFISSFLDGRDSETWHVRAREALHLAEYNSFTLKILEQFAYKRERFTDRRLNVIVGGIELDNPVMVGAGWDKVGKAVKGLYALGFSGVEVGSVLAYPQPGNAKTRQWMIGPGVALNRLGFNSPGADIVSQNLEKYRGIGIPLGISIGKNKDIPDIAAPQMHAIVAKKLYHDAGYFVINVSSPNTPNLRKLQDKEPLTDIVQAVNGAMDLMGGRKPLFVKIAPDLTNNAIDDVIEVVADNNLTGIIATNTTIRSDIKAKYGEKWRDEMGGLSGNDPDYRRMATERIAHIYRETNGQMEIIGVGGVNSAKTALEKIKAGARAVQVVTGIREIGPSLPGRINRGIMDELNREGINNVNELRGIDSKIYG